MIVLLAITKLPFKKDNVYTPLQIVAFSLEPKAECNWAIVQGVGILLIRYLEHSTPNPVFLFGKLLKFQLIVPTQLRLPCLLMYPAPITTYFLNHKYANVPSLFPSSIPGKICWNEQHMVEHLDSLSLNL